MLTIQVLHNRECTFWQTTWRMFEELVRERHIDARLGEVLVPDDTAAAQYRFFGSPQVVINGEDIDSMAERVTNFHSSGCRPYFYQGEHYDYPPLAMIEEALVRMLR